MNPDETSNTTRLMSRRKPMGKTSAKAPTAFLVSVESGEAATYYRLQQAETTIGRHPSCIVQVKNESISRHHAKLFWRDGRFFVADLESRNGTFVNEKPAEEQAIAEGDLIRFGDRAFLFTLTPPKGREKRAADRGERRPEVQLVPGHASRTSEVMARSAHDATDTFFQLAPADGKDANLVARASHRRLSLLYKLTENLRGARDIRQALEYGLALLFDALPAERGVALLRSLPDAPLAPTVLRRRTPDSDEEVNVSETVLERVMKDRVAVICCDTKEDTRFQASDSIRIHEMRSILCVPIISGDKAIGALHLDTHEATHDFTKQDLEFVAAVASELALTIENLRLQSRAMQSERMAAVGMTITNMAHNIKNILQLNKGALDLMNLSMAKVDDEQLQAAWRLVQSCLQRIGALTGDMLDFSRAPGAEPRLTDINECVRSHLADVDQAFKDKRIRLNLDLEEGLPPCLIDEVGLGRALMNLVVNASEAVDNDKGEIVVATARDESGAVIVTVQDNGAGIPPEQLDNIFEPFYTTKGGKGTGLGLSMVQKFVETMGGAIRVESEKGEGATFIMIFPEASPPGAATVPRPASTDDSPPQ